jgi:hypothetical protein
LRDQELVGLDAKLLGIDQAAALEIEDAGRRSAQRAILPVGDARAP